MHLYLIFVNYFDFVVASQKRPEILHILPFIREHLLHIVKQLIIISEVEQLWISQATALVAADAPLELGVGEALWAGGAVVAEAYLLSLWPNL